jgi:hypothetical protein
MPPLRESPEWGATDDNRRRDAGALNSREGEPGLLYIQGDHTGGMKYRNITISLPQR